MIRTTAEGIPFVRAIARAYGVPEYRIFGPELEKLVLPETKP